MNVGDDVVDELRETLAPELVLLERLGSGGMGDVFLARDPILKRDVAVKVLAQRLGLSAQARQRFAREAEAAAAVAHPNVVPIYRVGTLPRSELGYIVMARVDGPSLLEMVPEGMVASESDVRRIVAEVASALAAGHARGVVHRDIKPANVLYDPLGGRFVVVDFGIAAVLHRDTGGSGGRLTVDGVPVGTPSYMSPEQATGDQVVEKSDVYSLGCLAYELLTGKPPFTGPTAMAVVRAHLHDPPVPVGSLRSDVKPDLAALVMRCLAKEPADRPGADDITRMLGFIRRATIEWPPPGLESLHRLGAQWGRALGRFAVVLFLFVLILGIHPAGARPCCADSPDRSPGWLLLKRLSMVTPIHFDDPDALAIWYFLLDASFFVLLAALIPFVFRSVGLVRALVGAGRSGYPLAVLARVAWDRHRDTGDLLNLTGRYGLLEPERQSRQLRRRGIGSLAITLAYGLLIVTCLAWLGGALRLDQDPAAGLLPLAELALVAAPVVAGWVVYVVLEAMDLKRRRTPRVGSVTRHPLRRDVLDAWLTAAGVEAPRERWVAAVVRSAGVLGVLAATVTVIVAAYGLIAVFGASARFAGDRTAAREWLAGHAGGSDSTPPPLTPRIALSLAAPVPLDGEVRRILLGGRLPPSERLLLVESLGPAFCLNSREVLFGVARARLRERNQVAGLIGVDTTGMGARFDAAGLIGGGVIGLRRRARYCERYFGDQASISPSPRARD